MAEVVLVQAVLAKKFGNGRKYSLLQIDFHLPGAPLVVQLLFILALTQGTHVQVYLGQQISFEIKIYFHMFYLKKEAESVPKQVSNQCQQNREEKRELPLPHPTASSGNRQPIGGQGIFSIDSTTQDVPNIPVLQKTVPKHNKRNFYTCQKIVHHLKDWTKT